MAKANSYVRQYWFWTQEQEAKLYELHNEAGMTLEKLAMKVGRSEGGTFANLRMSHLSSRFLGDSKQWNEEAIKRYSREFQAKKPKRKLERKK